MATPLAFIKILLSANDENELKIPPAFVRSLKEPLPEEVHLRDRFKNVWIVKVAKVGDCFHFSDGWNKFARDNLLETLDLLEFEYYCHSWFAVKSFEPSGIEKNVVGPKMLKVIDHLDDDGDDDKDDDDDNDNENDSEDHVREVQERHQRIKQQNSAKKRRVTYTGGSTSKCRRTCSGECYGEEIFGAGLAQKPVNPYFVTKLKKRKNNLFIPKQVIEDYKLDLPLKIKLVDPRRRVFYAKCTKWKNGRMLLAGGWKSLCKVNLVTQDDISICEFVQGKGQRLYLKVSFVRGNMH